MKELKYVPRKTALFAIGFLVLAASFSLFWGMGGESWKTIFFELRVPRTLGAIAIGMILALAGLSIQTVLANPLAEPYLLGVASGAALGAAISTSLKIKWAIWGLNGGAVLGALLVIFLLFQLIQRSARGGESIILVGVLLNIVGSSLLAVWMALAEPLGVQSVTFWLLGDLTRIPLSTAVAMLVGAIAFSGLLWWRAPLLDAFLFGESWAHSFGVAPAKVRNAIIIGVSILVGWVVSAAGMIGFVGLIVPHLARRWVGIRHAHLVPLCAFLGAGLLTASDGLARAIADPHELPVGAVTALLGGPLFLWILSKRRTVTHGSGDSG